MRRFDTDQALNDLTNGPGIFVVERFLTDQTVQRLHNLALSYETDQFNGVRGALEKAEDLEDILFQSDIQDLCIKLFQTSFRLGSFDMKVTPPVAKDADVDIIIRHHIDYPGPGMVYVEEGETNPYYGIPLALKIFIPLSDLDKDSGGTEYIPYSHKWHRDPELHSSEFEMRMDNGETQTLEVPAGSVAFWSGPIWHADLDNKSSRTRILMHICIIPSFVLPPHDIVGALSEEYKANASSRMLNILGINDKVLIDI